MLFTVSLVFLKNVYLIFFLCCP